MKAWMCAFLFVCSLAMGCDPPDWSDKDVDFLIAKLESWHSGSRSRAVWSLKDKTGERERIIAALTHTLLNDTHEIVRTHAARALERMTPPAAEAVPELIEALHLPPEDRGKPIPWYMVLDVDPLPLEVEWALEEIGTPEALEAIEKFKKLETTLIESSVADGATDVDADFINRNGITLRFGGDRDRYCRMLTADGTTLWRQSVSGSTVTFKPEPDDPKLAGGNVYTLQVGAIDHRHRHSKITIAFTTKP